MVSVFGSLVQTLIDPAMHPGYDQVGLGICVVSRVKACVHAGMVRWPLHAFRDDVAPHDWHVRRGHAWERSGQPLRETSTFAVPERGVS